MQKLDPLTLTAILDAMVLKPFNEPLTAGKSMMVMMVSP